MKRIASRILLAVAVIATLTAPLRASVNATPSEAAKALGTGDIEQVIGPPQGAPLAGTALEKRTIEVSNLLRCPVCQGLSIADSPSPLAQKMKALVRAMLAAGYQQEQILRYFRYSYGDFVMLKPPVKGASATVWIAPVIALLLGGAVVWWWMRRSNRTLAATGPAPTATGTSAPSSPGVEADLEPYLERVRRLVDGETPDKPATPGNES